MRLIRRISLPLIFAIMLTACHVSQPPEQKPTGERVANHNPLDSQQPAWRPVPGTSWQIQLSGVLDAPPNVALIDLDLFDTPQSAINQLHGQNRKVVCYFSAGSWEDWRPDAPDFPPEILGNELEGWPGEQWLDIRQLDLLAPLMQARLDLARQKHCDGVDPDNMDGYQNDSGFDLTPSDQLAYNIWVAEQAHTRGLAAGLKNDLGQIPELVKYYDWALNEECFQYNECDELIPFVQAGKPVFGIEYQGDPAVFCPQANALNFDFLKKRLELDAWRQACR
jgi:hypothetical protein